MGDYHINEDDQSHNFPCDLLSRLMNEWADKESIIWWLTQYDHHLSKYKHQFASHIYIRVTHIILNNEITSSSWIQCQTFRWAIMSSTDSVSKGCRRRKIWKIRKRALPGVFLVVLKRTHKSLKSVFSKNGTITWSKVKMK